MNIGVRPGGVESATLFSWVVSKLLQRLQEKWEPIQWLPDGRIEQQAFVDDIIFGTVGQKICNPSSVTCAGYLPDTACASTLLRAPWSAMEGLEWRKFGWMEWFFVLLIWLMTNGGAGPSWGQ